jgi:hypothetical protein
MAVVLEAMPFRPTRRQRQHGVEPVQSLHRGLFIDGEHGRMLITPARTTGVAARGLLP